MEATEAVIGVRDNFIDVQHLIDKIMQDGAFPGSHVMADVHSDSGTEVPAVLWAAFNNGQFDHGLWGVTLSVTVICTPFERGPLISHLYRQIRSWDKPGKGILAEENYGVERVRDMTVFNLIHETVLNGKEYAQFNGTFDLTVRDWS